MCIHENGPIRVSKGFQYYNSSYHFTEFLHFVVLVGFFAGFCVRLSQLFGSHFRMPH